MIQQAHVLLAADDSGESWPGVLAGVLPFLLFGLASYANKLAGQPGIYAYPLFHLCILAGLAVGCARAFPRWSLVYLFWGLVVTWWATDANAAFFFERVGLHVDDRWGWRVWALLGAALLAGLVLARSLRPLRALAARLWHDWTWISLAAYVVPAWLVLIFDENQHPALPVLIAAGTLAAAAGAALYLRAGTSWRRGLGLLAGLAGLTVIDAYAWLTWDFAAFHGLPPAPTDPLQEVVQWGARFALWTTVLLGPAFASLWRPEPGGGEVSV